MASLTVTPSSRREELKVKLLAPARDDRLVAEGHVVRAGRSLTVCRGDAFTEGVERLHVATMLATIIGRPARSTEAV
jgi:acyl-coenzyme A thioesterase PaaI-like protein